MHKEKFKWEDKERCMYCRYHVKHGNKFHCNNESSDYYSDWTDASFGCDVFEMSNHFKEILAEQENENGKGK